MRALALLASAAMVVSLFLPWLSSALPGAGFVPWDLVRALNPDLDTVQRFVTESPAELVAFMATFPLAALFLVLTVIGLPSRLLALVTGGLATGIVVLGLWRAREGVQNLGLPLPSGQSLQDTARAVADVMGYGAWAWAGGAVILLLAGLVGFRR